MRRKTRHGFFFTRRWRQVTMIFILGMLLVPALAQAVTLTVEGSDGTAITDYRWVVERDDTFHVDPAAVNPVTQAIEFHKSYVPVVAEGTSADLTPLTNLDPTKHYYISVLPNSGYGLGGGPVKPGQAALQVIVHPNAGDNAIPTAQISVFVFLDNNPINNAPDLPAEQGLEGFKIILEEPAGRFGANGGQVLYDAFGNPLGTTYNPDGSVLALGNGSIVTDADGYALIKNLPPAKYGVVIFPPEGTGTWYKTTTIEGTRVIDAWVKANEPTTMVEFGIPTTHIFSGFVQSFNDIPAPGVGEGTTTIKGTAVVNHMARPPEFTLFGGHPFPDTLVAVNENGGGGFYVANGSVTGEFSIPNVPPGSYQLVLWDTNLDMIINFSIFDVPGPVPPAEINLGNVVVNDWFGHMWGRVFQDDNPTNGFMDPGEAGLQEQVVNIRWRDGSLYQSTGTGPDGFYTFDEIFPFFDWLVAEVDFARFKATGATFVADAGGGPVNTANPDFPFFGRTVPQAQFDVNPNTGNNLSRTETGEVLTQAFQSFAGLTNIMDFGKVPYGPGENGGISGIVYYDVTRAEDDPRFNAPETWQPGIARVQVNLYQDANGDGVIDNINSLQGVQLADVDNHPFQWAPMYEFLDDGVTPNPEFTGVAGPEDVDRNYAGQIPGAYDSGDAIDITTTDSWDDNLPTGCPGDPADPFYLDAKCYDGLRNYNQVRPGVFDGGYAFGDLANGIYIVEFVPPPGYKIVRSQDRNVDFGDEYVPAPAALPPICVGEPYVVPDFITLFSSEPAPLAGQTLSDCNRKQVELASGRNAAADGFMHTTVPIAAHFTGLVNNDLGNEFDPNSPNFQEKWGAPYVPVAFRDWRGVEVTRVYTDQWGVYNGLVTSTFTANIGNPSGFSPAMYSVCINDAGPIIDPVSGNLTIDPFFKREFSQSCYNFQFMPGTTTYLDTPMLSTAAFAGRQSFPLDCELPPKTPIIYSVAGSAGGAYVPAAGQNITITSQGNTTVENPAFDPIGNPGGAPATITRDYGFGATMGTVTLNGTALTGVSWSNGTITGTVPVGTLPGQYQLMVTRGDNGETTKTGVTVTVGPYAGNVVHVNPNPNATPIQDAIDAAAPGDLILLHSGSYAELVVMWKEVQIQGSGAPSTVLNAVKAPPEKLDLWKSKVKALVDAGDVTLLPGQGTDFGLFIGTTSLFPTELGPGILVMAQGPATPTPWGVGAVSARIDGLTVTGADAGGAILVNGYANDLVISNNKIVANQGVFGGGIRMGHPVDNLGFTAPVDAENNNVVIQYNYIALNGSTGGGVAGGIEGAGGGIAIYTGSDNYDVRRNYLCGNFSSGSGAGIGHHGLSNGGKIRKNEICFNQDFHQRVFEASGGGISISGITPAPPAVLSDGAGSVTVHSNLIQGNFAGAGDGGGIRLFMVNGTDVANSPLNDAAWHTINILNNVIVNNIAGLAGGGISLRDAVKANIIHNTIAHNDSSATAAGAVDPSLQFTNPQPAGVVSWVNSNALNGVLPGGSPAFSSPQLVNNIIAFNRSLYFTLADGILDADVPGPNLYRDLAVLGTAGQLDPSDCVLTSLVGFDGADYDDGTNIGGDPLFGNGYFNGSAGVLVTGDRQIVAGAALDEGGNFIDLSYGPLTKFGDYHIHAGSPAREAAGPFAGGPFAPLGIDIDGDIRPMFAAADIGADEYTGKIFTTFADVGVFRNGTWLRDLNGNGIWDGPPADSRIIFGLATDIPVVGDWNGDGVTEIGAFRNGTWILDANGNGMWDGPAIDIRVVFGLATDLPVTGDWNGDGVTDIGVFRAGTWILDANGNRLWDGPAIDVRVVFGLATDIPVTGEWDGDGDTDIGVFRNGSWILDFNGNRFWDGPAIDKLVAFGLATDQPVTGDWNNDGTTEIGYFRNGTWSLDTNGNGVLDGTDTLVVFGMAGDQPVPGKW